MLDLLIFEIYLNGLDLLNLQLILSENSFLRIFRKEILN